jgi:hypothetical protein
MNNSFTKKRHILESNMRLEKRFLNEKTGDMLYKPAPFKNAQEGNQFREWVNDKYPFFADTINLDRKGSFNNKYIRQAYDRYGKEYESEKSAEPFKFSNYQQFKKKNTIKDKKQKNLTDKTKTKKLSQNEGFVIPFAFPTYEPKCDGNDNWAQFVCSAVRFFSGGGSKGTYGTLGHGGVATVDSNGNTSIFEFGRYGGASKQGYGNVVSVNLGKIAKIEGDKISNVNSLLRTIKSRTHGEGPRLTMEYAVLPAPNINQGVSYAKNTKEKDYSALDFSISNDAANCGTFALEVVKKSGVGISNSCFPTPVQMINSMKRLTDVKGQV